MPGDDMICVGAIAGAFGVRGEVRLKSFCAVPEDIETYAPLVTEDGNRSFSVALIGSIQNGFTARLGGIDTKEQADALKGVRLYAQRAQLPMLPDDEYYHADLIGLPVHDTGGTLLGEVRSVLNHGAGDLLEILAPGASDTVLLPFTRAIVPTVDLAAGRIVADPPENMFPA
ncbi:ribosome maturation factor RimM [Sedimentitalea arenosa]|jgi:16S rRNA processing protein RimM|uniref:Ribosome maturation factor RimM n=1 Tax=Sedimentitalea arenosa TaxID=2798803 RepID=A0A8J7IVL5_9RHOB|nr:ribosome maturation factor RimM [Arenibacterium arenosum]MBJ6372177.1 16S rRNA processing protein RimM [Arenibacterium arenosum]